MILSCPHCQTRFLATASLFEQQARWVRCGRCQHSWHVPATNPDATNQPALGSSALGSSDLPQILLEDAPLAAPEDDGIVSKLFRWWKYGVLALVVVLVGWLIFDRQDIAKHRPFIENVYNKAGLRIYHYRGEGLMFDQVRSELHFEGGMMKLTVAGKIHNNTPYEEEIPNIMASAIGPDGQVMQSWQIDAPAHSVVGQDFVPFTSAITSPKGTVVDLNLSFIEIKKDHE